MPRASHYILRPGATTRLPSGMLVQAPGRFVPLIAVDQLPDWLEIVGVPRELTLSDASDMIAIGSCVEPVDRLGTPADDVFDVRLLDRDHHNDSSDNDKSLVPTVPTVSTVSTAQPASGPPSLLLSPTTTAVSDTPKQLPSNAAATTSQNAAAYRWRRQKRETAHTKPKAADDTTQRLPCKHWCQTGFCAYKPTCRYVHTMPTTPEGLRNVGLHSLPDWYTSAAPAKTDPDGRHHRGRRGRAHSPLPPTKTPLTILKAPAATGSTMTTAPAKDAAGSSRALVLAAPHPSSVAAVGTPVSALQDEEDLMDLTDL